MQLDTAMRWNSRETERDILRVALGEIQTVGKGLPVSDEVAENVIRKIVAGIDETLTLSSSPLFSANHKVNEPLLQEQKAVLEALLPKLWTRDEIEAFFLENESPLFEQIQEMNHEGKAIGLAVKALKEAKAPVNGEDVRAVVDKIRKAQ